MMGMYGYQQLTEDGMVVVEHRNGLNRVGLPDGGQLKIDGKRIRSGILDRACDNVANNNDPDANLPL